MDLQAEQIHLISQVLSIRDAGLLVRARQFLDQLVEQADQNQHLPWPARPTEAEFLAKMDESEAALERGEVFSHEEVVAHFSHRKQ